MGTYLSTPILEKNIDNGEESKNGMNKIRVAWACVEMQGWRKNMEDAHVAEVGLQGLGLVKEESPVSIESTDMQEDTAEEEDNNKCSEVTTERVFGVFDGHGGAEVARFCQKHFVSVLTSRDEWAKGDVGAALTETYFHLDRMIDNPINREQIFTLKNVQPPPPQPPQQQQTSENNSTPSGGTSENEDVQMTESSAAPAPSTSPSPKISDDAMHILEKLLSISAAANNSNPQAVSADNQTNSSSPENNPNTPPNSSMTLTDTPTRILHGRQVCNLPEHPIHAGCTAVSMVISHDNYLTVANSGDSRGVICRKDGQAVALSQDHKPLKEVEMQRIQNAGGFVNHLGRVNGNLNVSRSIGDLKYKQRAGIPPSAQMITADPDILRMQLEPEDEFIILGCDGIWDCLTNQECVDFIRQRIDNTSLTDIGIEMLDSIISKDPRASQGIGGDNMTCLIVDLKPNSRALTPIKKEIANGNLENPTSAEEHENTIMENSTPTIHIESTPHNDTTITLDADGNDDIIVDETLPEDQQ